MMQRAFYIAIVVALSAFLPGMRGGGNAGYLPFRVPAFGTTTMAECPDISAGGYATITLTASGGARPSNGEVSQCDGHSYGASDSYEPTLDLLIIDNVTRTKGIPVNGGHQDILIGGNIDPTSDSSNELVFITGASIGVYIEGIYATGADNPANGQDFIDYSGVLTKGKVTTTGNLTSGGAGPWYLTNLGTVTGLVDHSTCNPTLPAVGSPCMVVTGGSLLNNTEVVAVNPAGCTAPCVQIDRPPNNTTSGTTLNFSFYYLTNYILQNNKAVSLHGFFNGTHSDCGQNVGPVGTITVANLSCTTNYQGQFDPPKYQWTSLTFQNIGITWQAYYGALTTVTGAVACGNGDVCLQMASNANYKIDEVAQITGVVGTTEANGIFTLTPVSTNELDEQGNAFVNAYGSGGNISTPNDQSTIAVAVYMTAGDAEAPYAPIGNPVTFGNTFACWNRSPLYSTGSVQPLGSDAVAPSVAFDTNGATWNSPLNITGGVQSGCPADFTMNVTATTTSANYQTPGYQ